VGDDVRDHLGLVGAEVELLPEFLVLGVGEGARSDGLELELLKSRALAAIECLKEPGFQLRLVTVDQA
jgi:hypothetical protein